MKTLLTAAALFFAGAAFSQNTLEFHNYTGGGIVGEVVISYVDDTKEVVFVGGPGTYTFDIGSQEVEALVFGSTVCEIGVPTTITLQFGGTATQIIDPPKRKGKRSDGSDDSLIYTSLIR